MEFNRFKGLGFILMFVGLGISLCLGGIGPIIDPTMLEYPTSPETIQKYAPYVTISGISAVAGGILAIIGINLDNKKYLGANDSTTDEMKKMEESLNDWNRSNPNKKPFKRPICYGSVEKCRECNECFFYTDCNYQKSWYAERGIYVENGVEKKIVPSNKQ